MTPEQRERLSRTVQGYYDRARQYQQSRPYAFNWHPWFAWRPVKVDSGECRWLEWIERRRKEDFAVDSTPFLRAFMFIEHEYRA
jgi:hypothetical protein